jgi:predicted kinase
MFHTPTFTQTEHDTVYATLDYMTELLLKSGISVIYDGNLNRLQHRREKYAICERTNAKPVLLWLQTTKELAKQRATERNHVHLVPKDETVDAMFERVANTIEPPIDDEHPIPFNGTEVTKEDVRRLLDQVG